MRRHIALFLFACILAPFNTAAAQQQSLREACYQSGRPDGYGNSTCVGELAKEVFSSMGDWDSRTMARGCDWARFRYCEERLIDQEGVCWYWIDWGRPWYKCFIAPRDGYSSRRYFRYGYIPRFGYGYGLRYFGEQRRDDPSGVEGRADGDARRGSRSFPFQSQRPAPSVN
jgi:hypothetical protein